jgi:quercetin dioxygenase-like cupin family protein
MRFTGHRFGGVMASIYYLASGERIDWHQHPVAHSTGVSAGRSLVDVGDDVSLEMRPGDPDYELPPNIRHRVTALEDGTIVVHMIERIQSDDPPPVGPDGKPRTHGGVLLDTGEIIYDNDNTGELI